MSDMKISQDITWIGANDNELKLFESQYILEHGMSYNSYLIKDEKNVVLDTIDKNVTNIWKEKLEKALDGENVDYLIISHMEPDHAYNIGELAKKYPKMKLVGNQMTFNMLANFFSDIDLSSRKVIVTEGDVLDIGKHKLQFFMAPMVHWPEVMVTYDNTDKILFSADAFGKFGSLDINENWDDEARRYYFGIVGKYGMQVQALLNKALTLDIQIICPLHGPVLKEKLSHYLDKYAIWGGYKPEVNGVYIPCASIYGNSLKASYKMQEILKKRNIEVKVEDLDRCDWAEAVANSFKYSHIIFVSSSYNAGAFPPMLHLLEHLKSRNFQSRKVAIIENGSWAPSAGKTIKTMLQEMRNMEIIEPIITIKSTLKEKNIEEMERLAENFIS